MIANNGHDKQGLWSFDPKEKKYKELIYRRSDGDLLSTRDHSNIYTNGEEITAVAYFDGRDVSYEWFNGEEKQYMNNSNPLIPEC